MTTATGVSPIRPSRTVRRSGAQYMRKRIDSQWSTDNQT